MLDKLKPAARRLLHSVGLEITRHKFSPGYLQRYGFAPQTVFDVGVHRGTPELYRAFPEAHFVLVEPQADAESLLESRPARYEIVPRALGAERGTLELHACGGKTGFLERTELTRTETRDAYEVEVVTLDELIEDRSFAEPFGLKIDVEGFELEVLKGMVRCVDSFQFIIAEANVQRRFANSYLFSDIVTHLAQKGFELIDVLDPPSITPRFLDVMFVPRSHPAFHGV